MLRVGYWQAHRHASGTHSERLARKLNQGGGMYQPMVGRGANRRSTRFVQPLTL